MSFPEIVDLREVIRPHQWEMKLDFGNFWECSTQGLGSPYLPTWAQRPKPRATTATLPCERRSKSIITVTHVPQMLTIWTYSSLDFTPGSPTLDPWGSTLSRMITQHFHRRQNNCPPCMFCLQNIGMVIWRSLYKNSENHLFYANQRMQPQDEVTWRSHYLLWVAWKETTGLAAEPWQPSFLIWAVTTKLSFCPSTAALVQLHWGREKSSQCLLTGKQTQ